MYELFKFAHLAAAIVWMGGMALMIWAIRPVAIAQLEPVQRLPLLAGILTRFLKIVGLCVLILLATGGHGEPCAHDLLLANFADLGVSGQPAHQHNVVQISSHSILLVLELEPLME